MPNPDQPRVLVVANRTSSTPTLLDKIAERARAGASFTLLIPADHGDHVDWSPEAALKLVEQAADGPVAGLDGGEDSLDTIHRAVSAGEFDELIVCTAPAHLARWVHHDLPHRLQHLGLPVVVIAPEPDASVPDYVRTTMAGAEIIAPLPGGGGEF